MLTRDRTNCQIFRQEILEVMMKRIFALIAAMILAFAMTGCNMGLGFGNFSFHGVHVCDYSGTVKDFKVLKWYENDTGIEVLTDKGSIFCSEGTYVMYEDECPICN